MSTVIDSKGFPELFEDQVDLAVVAKVAEGRPGNDFHDKFTGKFTYAPSGVRVLSGGAFLKAIDSTQRQRLFNAAAGTKANQLGVKLINGQLQAVLLRDGRRIISFSLGADPTKGKNAPQTAPDGSKEGAPVQLTPALRDTIVDAARDLNLTGDKLTKFIEDRAEGELSPGDIASIINLIKDQQLNDLVDYLHQQLRRIVKKETTKDEIRISVGRGFLRKSFANLDKAQTVEVLTRLQARGWLEKDIQDHVADSLPKRLRNELNAVHKEGTPNK